MKIEENNRMGKTGDLFKKTGEGFPGSSVVKNPPASAGDIRDVGSIPGSGRSPGRGHSNPLWYCCLENPMDRETWWATVPQNSQSL